MQLLDRNRDGGDGEAKDKDGYSSLILHVSLEKHYPLMYIIVINRF